MDLFSADYREEIEVFRLPQQLILSGCKGFFLGSYNKEYCIFHDEWGNYWLYNKNQFIVNAPNGTINLEQGEDIVLSSDVTYKRVKTPEEVIQKAEEHFLQFAVQKDNPEINFRPGDSFFHLN